MPIYTFRRRSTGEEWTETMKISEMEEIIKDSDIHIVPQPIGVRDNFVSNRFTNLPLDSDFKNMLDNMKKANPGSTIDY